MTYQIRHVTHCSTETDKQEALKFSSGTYLQATRSRLEAQWGDEAYGLAAAFSGSLCIGTSAYTVSSRGQAILAQVFTHPDHRGQGIARATIAEAIEGGRRHGARVYYLAAWEDWKRALYKGFGFRFVGAMGERHAFKLVLDPSGEDAALFAKGQNANIRSMGDGDQADLCSLFNAQQHGPVKHYELGCYLGSHFEGEFYSLAYEFEGTGLRCVVLDGEETILGFGTVIPSRLRHQGHRGVLDLLVHPNYAHLLPDVLDALHQGCPLDLLTAYVEDSDDVRRSALEQAGYADVGRLAGWLRVGDRNLDVTVYEKVLGRLG